MHQCFLRPYASGVRCAPTLRERFLQFQEYDYSILSAAKKQLSALQTAKSLYIKAMSHLLNEVNPLVRIIFKHYLFSLSLETRLNLRLPVETGTVYCPVFILVNCLFFYEQPQIHYQLQWICDDGIYSAVRNVSYVILHIPPQPMC